MQATRKQRGEDRLQTASVSHRLTKVVFQLTTGLFACIFLCTASSFLPVLNYGQRGIILTRDSLSIDGLTLYFLLLLCGLLVMGALFTLVVGLLNVRQASDKRATKKLLPWSVVLLCVALLAMASFLAVRTGCPSHLPATGGSGDDIWYCSWTYPWRSPTLPLHP